MDRSTTYIGLIILLLFCSVADARLGDLIVRANLIIGDPTVPSTPTSTGVTGQMAWDSNYIYWCIATNTWKRALIETWSAVSENVVFAGEDVVFSGENVIYP